MVLALGLGVGCATTDGPSETDPQVTPMGTPGLNTADVVFVRAEERYLIVRGERLPNAGEQARVFRDERPVGTVRFTGLQQGGFAAADIVEGVLQPGDRVVR